MIVIGGKPDGRHTEQHDVFFGVGDSLKDLVPQMELFWPELVGKMHIDSWRKISHVGGFSVEVVLKNDFAYESDQKLYFVNLGGYKPQDMEEYHYKQIVVASNLAEATQVAKSSTFWKHHTSSHIDDKYGIDVDDIYEVTDLLSPSFKTKYSLKITADSEFAEEDTLEVGYLKISKLLSWD